MVVALFLVSGSGVLEFTEAVGEGRSSASSKLLAAQTYIGPDNDEIFHEIYLTFRECTRHSVFEEPKLRTRLTGYRFDGPTEPSASTMMRSVRT